MRQTAEKTDIIVCILIGAYLLAVLGVCLVLGEKMRVAVPDNLDLFQAQYQMLKNEGLFTAREASAPFLHGVTRDDLPSELLVPGLFYRMLPSFRAYWALYIAKVLLAVISFYLLFRESVSRHWIPEEKGALSIALLCGFAFGILNLFPAYGICFASLPLILFLLLRLDRENSIRKRILLYFGILIYPAVSYFSYFGLFIIGYTAAAFLITSLVRRKWNMRLFLAVILLSAGSVLFEYRLFRSMLFSDEVTIRSTMVIADLDLKGILSMMREVLHSGGAMHTQSMQQYIVLPACLLYFIILNGHYIFTGRIRSIFRDVYNAGAFLLFLNSLIYGLYYCGPFRRFIEMLVPPLTGWQFGRTSFLNPFLWYGLFCIALIRLLSWLRRRDPASAAGADSSRFSDKKGTGPRFLWIPYMLCLASISVILLSDTDYNDLYHTAHAEANRVLRGVTENSLTYSEFYSEALFSEIMEDIGYEGEWSAAYGLHPATLEYNGIRTIDGYLGFYSQDYKDSFRKIIAPALEKQPATMAYYDNWGARCYLYSGNHSTIVEAVRAYPHPEDSADLDIHAMQALGCRYIFSRPRITNAPELGLTLLGSWASDSSPYIIYVYSVPE